MAETKPRGLTAEELPDVVEDRPVVPPPASLQTDFERKPILYLPNGKVLVRRAGF